jgi:VanZ family protein
MTENNSHEEQSSIASASARIDLLVYTLLIVYASWYPFSGWRSMGIAPWAFLFQPLPYYWTWFDVVTNILAYMPFGALVVFALYPRVRGFIAVVVALICGALLSGTMEAVQTYIPNRISDKLDFLTNAGGALLGAVIGMLLSRSFLEQGRTRQLRKAWFTRDASRGLIVVMLWPLAQIYPQAYLFGHGQILPILSHWLSNLLGSPIDLAEPIVRAQALTVQEYWLAETIITACGLTGALLTLSCILRKQAPKARLLIALAVLALVTKALANALLFTPDNAFAWVTPSARGGLLVGALMTAGLAFARPIAQRWLAVAALVISAGIANLAPTNPYFTATLQAWTQGKFLNFDGAAQFLSLIWPFFAMWFLLHPVHRLKQD